MIVLLGTNHTELNVFAWIYLISFWCVSTQAKTSRESLFSIITVRWQQQTVCEFEYVEYGGEQQQSQTLELQSALISQEKSTA